MRENGENSSGNILLGLILGLVFGGILGLLLAPDSGEKSREKGAKALKDLTQRVREDLDNPYGVTRTTIDKARYKVQQSVDNLKRQSDAKKHAKAKAREHLDEDLEPTEANV